MEGKLHMYSFRDVEIPLRCDCASSFSPVALSSGIVMKVSARVAINLEVSC